MEEPETFFFYPQIIKYDLDCYTLFMERFIVCNSLVIYRLDGMMIILQDIQWA